MPDLQALLDQIDRLDQDATDGPWDHESLSSTDPTDFLGPYAIYSLIEVEYSYMREIAGYENGPGIRYADAEFIAASRALAPAMAKALKAVLEICDVNEKIAQDSLSRMFDGEHFPAIAETAAIRQAITDALGGDDGAR